MITDDIYAKVEESSHETAFNRGEVDGLYEVLQSLPEGASILEIGIQFGRSTTVIAEVAKEKWFDFIAVDNWKEENGKEAHSHVLKQMKKYKWDIQILSMDSIGASKMLNNYIFDLVHIDGDHSYLGVKTDCELWLPKIKRGGFACFDDYGHPGIEAVENAVQSYLETDRNFTPYGYYGNKLKVFRKNE